MSGERRRRSEKHYTTPPGKDERIVENPFYGNPEALEIMEKSGMVMHKWRGYNFLIGDGLNTDYLRTIETMRTNEESLIIVCAAPPGKGKTYGALRFAQIFDPNFDVNLQVCFKREQILYLTGKNSPLKRGQVIIIDEAQYSAGNRSWFEEIQRMLMNNLAAIRSKGYIIMIVVLHLDMCDKVIRKYVLSFMHYSERRGVLTVYRLYTPRFDNKMHKNKLGELLLKLPDNEKCSYKSCLSCYDHQDYCMSMRAVYERNKKAFIDEMTDLAEAKARIKIAKDNMPGDEILIDLIWKDHRERLTFNDRNRNIDSSSIQQICSELGYPVGDTTAKNIGKRLKSNNRMDIAKLYVEWKKKEDVLKAQEEEILNAEKT